MSVVPTSQEALFIVFYIAVSFCFVLRTKEFISAGLVVESIFERILTSEHANFINYHILRTSITLMVHSLLPLGYVFGVYLVSDKQFLFSSGLFWSTCQLFSFIFPLITAFTILKWRGNDWSNHPIAKTLQLYCDANTTWKQLAASIGMEFISVDKIILEISTLTKIVVTDNWIIKVSPYSINLAHQSDSVLVLCSSDTHQMSVDGDGSVQYVNIEVKSTRTGVNSFFIRCNALDFNELQNRIRRPIQILPGITFHKTQLERFLDVFKETVERNPLYEPSSRSQLDTDSCIGCMVAKPAVKLVKCCQGQTNCTECSCRPLWCLECMGKWFASRQAQNEPETWLCSKCTCPVCRSIFCVLDVCPISEPQS